MTITSDLYVLLDHHGPLDCTRHDLATRIGCTVKGLTMALYDLRRPERIAANGWTVPYQPSGNTPKAWRIVGVNQLVGLDRHQVRSSIRERVETCGSMVERTRAMADIICRSLGTTTTAGRSVRTALIQLDAAFASLDLAALTI